MSHAIEAYRLLPGMLLARKFRLTRKIGQGAMGVVWAATNESTGREVALKLIARPDPSLRKRLLREAQSCGALQHPNIVDVIDVTHTDSGEPCLIMELLVGDSVAELLEARRRLQAPLAARIAHDVAGALGAAHAVQIVHRDLKPANIFVHRPPDADDFVVKVLDFGVAKNLAVARGVSSTMDAAVGSPFYMSPEQVRADGDVDARSDLWALGVVLFEMLTGVRPFQGEGPQLLSQILSGEIPKVSRYLRHVDERLVTIVDRCLRRDRAERFAAAEDVARALSELMLPAGAHGAAAQGAGAPPEVSAAEAGAGAGWRESQARTATHAESGWRASPMRTAAHAGERTAPLSRTASEQETAVVPERGQGRAPTPDELATTVPVKPAGQPQRGGAQAPAQGAQGRSPAGGAVGGALAAGAEPMVTHRGTLVMRGEAAAVHQHAAEMARAKALAQRADVARASAQPAAREREGGKAGRRRGKGLAVVATLVVGLIVGVLAATWIVGWEKASNAPAGADAGRAPSEGVGAVKEAPPAATQVAATGAPAAVAPPEQPAVTGARANAPGSAEAGPTDVDAGGKGSLTPGTAEAVKAGERQGERPPRAAETMGTAGQRAPASGVASAQPRKQAPEKRDEVYEELFGAPAPAARGASPVVEKPAPEKKPPAPARPFN
ncbi:hypothetical protein BE11_23345 [Sorangium cellulosum]|nr:hypothetical protein BE11_23345 [Sorangium cellulosum]